MTRVVHTGDTHIGYRQYHSPERREDFMRAFEQVIADAIELDVDAVVHAGDLFHDVRPDLADLLASLDALRELAAADIPFLAIVGNHERTRDRQWLDLFEELELAVRLDGRGTEIGDVTFYGLDYVPHSQRESVDVSLEAPTTPHAALVAHGLFEPFAHADWATDEFLGELSVDLDALLLGDNHEPGQARVDGTLVTYCGSTERTSAAEETQRGYNLISFGDGEARLSRRSLNVIRPFEYIEVELAAGEGLERIRDRITERDLTDAVAIIRIDGEGEDVTPATVEELALDAGALVARVTDRREQQSESDHEVSFADPSRAIDERLRSMALSDAAHEVEGIIRDDGIADANVRDRVTERMSALMEDDLSAFEPPDPAPEAPPTEDADPAPDVSQAPADETEEAARSTSDPSDEDVTPDAPTSEPPPNESGDTAADPADAQPAEDPATTPGTDAGEDADDQRSLFDY